MTHVSYDLQDRVAVLTVDNPPVNALGQAVRQGLWDAITRFDADDGADAAVIIGAGRLFIGGADITEFGKPPVEPYLPDVINRIADSPKPVVAAIHGTALGGGLEVALGAHYRIATPTAKLGLPEVTLGVMPGAGGTQRMPRLVGAENALTLMTAGRPVTGAQALDMGFVDVLAGDNLRADAMAYAAKLVQGGTGPRRVSDMPFPQLDADLVDGWRKRLTQSARGQVAPLAVLDAVVAGARMPFAQALAAERKAFLSLLKTPQRAGLMHAFFAERAVAKVPQIKGIAPRPVTRAGVVGGGTMGAGIATAMVLSGLHVTLVERDAASAARARDTITRNLSSAVKRGKLTEAGRDAILSDALATATDYAALSQADLVVEAVFEDMAVKAEVFRQLDRVCKPGAVLATNTSYLDVNLIAGATHRPEDVIGLHFFSPAHVMKLLEIVVTNETAVDVTATAFQLAKTLGKVGVRAGVCDGFIGNRILSHYRTAVDHMVLDGASPYAIDRALVEFGFAMGPYQVGDLAGLDIGYMTRQRKAAQAHPRDRAPLFADALYHAGWLGQKTGRGYYIYDDATPKGRPNDDVPPIIRDVRDSLRLKPREFSAEQIVRRTMAAMVNEAARVVDEGIAQRPSDVDVVFLSGYGFPRFRGGPMHHADTVGLDVILSDIRDFAVLDDHFWKPAPLLERLVRDRRTFASLNT
ncbi:3-hydroxyacyl-CoA dehydrogenase [Loktanella sp. 3ANDIMAR09]|uniref:3-hydroxyacyl-CoA dehydrogenase NAD-binding domain-containing protein n=1 Tax=Loktanella sp. 3ANDIMAR09 TaxID=1225657 RepID=UPI000700EC5C|nr:3-hydroxyacyl-CoA dehydrogenase NAD-binding domain-containing protein [Loktanella sp. 3ANDIMAR09]KQI68978.1 3-hydroxyacyl-CoA dehydrogenase [Loktanella sp. 3ANDIMAR09]